MCCRRWNRWNPKGQAGARRAATPRKALPKYTESQGRSARATDLTCVSPLSPGQNRPQHAKNPLPRRERAGGRKEGDASVCGGREGTFSSGKSPSLPRPPFPPPKTAHRANRIIRGVSGKKNGQDDTTGRDGKYVAQPPAFLSASRPAKRNRPSFRAQASPSPQKTPKGPVLPKKTGPFAKSGSARAADGSISCRRHDG